MVAKKTKKKVSAKKTAKKPVKKAVAKKPRGVKAPPPVGSTVTVTPEGAVCVNADEPVAETK
jgi:hypothetical protein